MMGFLRRGAWMCAPPKAGTIWRGPLPRMARGRGKRRAPGRQDHEDPFEAILRAGVRVVGSVHRSDWGRIVRMCMYVCVCLVLVCTCMLARMAPAQVRGVPIVGAEVSS
eukprot:scaffold7738_cov107-Isochrysis_galbana.AAC.9